MSEPHAPTMTPTAFIETWRPSRLDHAHRALDEAVAAAYGWPADLTDDDILAKLFALNQARAGKES